MGAKTKQRDRDRLRPGTIAPSRERASHGIVELLGHAIADDAGAPGQPYRAVDTLATMERRGSITDAMRRAGEMFRDRWTQAAWQSLRAADVIRAPHGRATPLPMATIDARNEVWEALKVLGGQYSACGSCAWHVLGEEMTVRFWAGEYGWADRAIGEKTASGILIGTLGVLALHYGLEKP